jgi:hypothetical protein
MGEAPDLTLALTPRSRRSSASADDRHPLLFAAGHLVRQEEARSDRPSQPSVLSAATWALHASSPSCSSGGETFSAAVSPGSKLKCTRSCAAAAASGVALHIGQRLPASQHFSASRFLRAPGDGQQGTLARAARRHHRHYRALTGWPTSASACAPAVRANASSESPVRGLVLLAGDGFEPRGADAFELLAAPAASLPRCRSFWLADARTGQKHPVRRAVEVAHVAAHEPPDTASHAIVS